jgi:hypothetical protein
VQNPGVPECPLRHYRCRCAIGGESMSWVDGEESHRRH